MAPVVRSATARLVHPPQPSILSIEIARFESPPPSTACVMLLDPLALGFGWAKAEDAAHLRALLMVGELQQEPRLDSPMSAIVKQKAIPSATRSTLPRHERHGKLNCSPLQRANLPSGRPHEPLHEVKTPVLIALIRSDADILDGRIAILKV